MISSVYPLNIVNEDGQSYENNKDMSNYCNKYFSSVGRKMAENIKLPKDFYFQIVSNNSTMFLIHYRE